MGVTEETSLRIIVWIQTTQWSYHRSPQEMHILQPAGRTCRNINSVAGRKEYYPTPQKKEEEKKEKIGRSQKHRECSVG